MKNQQGIVWAPILIIVAFVIVAGYFLFKADNSSQTEKNNANVMAVESLNSNTDTHETTRPENGESENANENSRTNVNTSDPTVEWKTYTNNDLGFSFRYPKELGDVIFIIADGETGKKFNGTFSESNVINFGGINSEFSEGRGGHFLDTQGYVKDGSVTYYKFVNNSRIKIDVLKEVAGINMTSVLVKGTDEYSAANPGTHAVGAVMNLPNNGQFAGLAIRTLDVQKVSQTTFEQILSTFRFTN